ncbi:flagellar protein FlaG [Bacillus sp. 03113]|uniref:flagellar protein FlaG n=1 Tax=Bacillus sp. 03113 TaxID=2578211 RepID=UPI001141319F|nr:flagellar protein FlaG [Bacillus sp. 03113]
MINGVSSRIQVQAAGLQETNQKTEAKIEQQPNDLTNQAEIRKEKIEDIVQGLNKFMQPSHTSLKFELHEKLNEYYVKVVDDKTQQVIREIPSKKLLDMYAAMTDFLGLLVDKRI